MYFGGRRPLEVTCRHPGRLRDDFLMVFDGFGPPFRVPGGAFGGHFGACFVKGTFFNRFLEEIFRTPKKERKRSSQGVCGHAIRSRRRMFREGRHLSTWHRFGLHFGSVLGAQVGTILRFGRPGVQIGCPAAVGWERVCFVVPRVPKWSISGGPPKEGFRSKPALLSSRAKE